MAWLSKWCKKPEKAPPEYSDLPIFLAALQTDVGCIRTSNEDAGRIVFGDNGNRGLLVVVADGMGGHEAGEVASQKAVETIAEVYLQAKGTPGKALEYAFQRAHEEIRKLAADNQAMAGMGTTCTALALVGKEAWAAHVGDSRLYLVRSNNIYQLSEDHSAVMEMVRQGLLSAEEAHRHEDRNVLIRAMGTKPELLPMLWPEPMDVRQGDTFVLCSDGLHDQVQEEEIRAVVCGAQPEEACHKLVQMARERGGYDNVTVAVVLAEAANSPPAFLKETRGIEVKP
jgi:protein phosphatase